MQVKGPVIRRLERAAHARELPRVPWVQPEVMLIRSALRRSEENQKTQGLPEQKHTRQLTLEGLAPKQTWHWLCGRSDRVILRAIAIRYTPSYF